MYFPDFYLEDLNLYIEVKGYERERDLTKWKVVNNLLVIKKSDISLIKENRFQINANLAQEDRARKNGIR